MSSINLDKITKKTYQHINDMLSYIFSKKSIIPLIVIISIIIAWRVIFAKHKYKYIGLENNKYFRYDTFNDKYNKTIHMINNHGLHLQNNNYVSNPQNIQCYKTYEREMLRYNKKYNKKVQNAAKTFSVTPYIHKIVNKLFEPQKTNNWKVYNNDGLDYMREHVYVKTSKISKISKGEQICKDILEQLFDKEFVSIRPDWLKNPETGRNLEIDCYNEELKLAVEVSGKQHYQHVKHFHKTQEAFYKQMERDTYKRRKILERGLTFIEIPNTVKHNHIYPFLIKLLRQYGYKV
jgi:hypothetical protein